ncbi:hypothetical protein AAC387_Pa10g2039 [Persea americana]
MLQHLLISSGASYRSRQPGGPDSSVRNTCTTWNLRTAGPRPSDSSVWKTMLKHRQTILNNQKWVIGNGLAVNALTDVWVPGFAHLGSILHTDNPPFPTASVHLYPDLQTLRVSDLIDDSWSLPRWDAELIHSLWPQHGA